MTTNYGYDLSCVSDLTPLMAEVSGRRLLSEALVRRLQTPRGALIDDPNYGYDLVGEVNDDLGPSDVGRIQANVQAEMLKDERVIAAAATATFLNGTLTVNIAITDGVGPFTLTLSVTSGLLTVQLLEAA